MRPLPAVIHEDIAPPTSAHSLYIKRGWYRGERVIVEVDKVKSQWFRTAVKDLGAYGRRKFENWIINEHPGTPITVIYG